MKKIIIISLAAVLISSCQQKQAFTECAEIDLVKKANEAYLKGDWQNLRTFYADTAIIYVNTWARNRLTPDELIEQFKSSLADMQEYKISDQISQMVVTEKGEHNVNQWFEWTGKHKNGKEIRSVIGLSCQVENNEIVFFGLIYDTLPFYQAAQADSVGLVAAN